VKKQIIVVIAIVISLTQIQCKKDNPVGPNTPAGISGNINAGAFTDLTTKPIGTGGGTISVSKQGDPLDGFTLTVPPNSFTQTKTFAISYTSVTSHNFGPDYTAISPLIKISYDGDYSDQFMAVKIPIKLPAGSFASGFIYDESTGQLEGLPIEELTDSFIVVATRHFTTFSSLNKTSFLNATKWEDDLIIFSVLETKLSGNLTIATGFYPGFDDWEFVNHSIYISPGGICAGMSITSLWYYLEKSKSAGTLFHRFDSLINKTEPGWMWYDNPRGIKFASSIQQDINQDAPWVTEIQMQSLRPDLIWKIFLHQMLITKQPQLVFVMNSKTLSGHAMIVYKIDLTQNKLYIADPNYPGNYDFTGINKPVVQTISYSGGKFQPYISWTNADGSVVTYDLIGSFGVTQYIPINKIRSRWDELLNGTIGNDRFPKYTLQTYPDNKPVTDGLTLTADSLKVVCISSDCASGIDPTSHRQVVEITDSTGVYLGQADQTTNGIAAVKLNPGINKLGFYIQGVNGPGYTNVRFVDFKWMHIKQSGPSGGTPCPGIPTVTYSGKTYNTILIGSQCWLKENLDVGTMIRGAGEQTNNGTIEKYCYHDTLAYCNIYGGLYQWAEAVQYKNGATNSTSPNPAFTGNIQGICPPGWHIPSGDELIILGGAAGNDGNALKAIGQGTGTNTSGFSALLAGYRTETAYFSDLGNASHFWSTLEGDIYSVYHKRLLANSEVFDGFTWPKSAGLSIRCVKD